MTKAQAQHIILDSVVELVRDTDNSLLWEALYTLCPHLEYMHGGSMGLVCSVCGAMPPDADVPDEALAIEQHAALRQAHSVTTSETTILVDGEQTTVGDIARANTGKQDVLAALRDIENGAASVDIDLGVRGSIHITKVVKEPACDCGSRSDKHSNECELVAEGFV